MNARSGDAAACIAFVQAFIATTERLDGASTVGGAHSSVEFSERAARARGAARLRALLAERNRYCIGADLPAEEIVRRVSLFISGLDPETESVSASLSERAEHVVRQALVASFPCSDR